MVLILFFDKRADLMDLTVFLDQSKIKSSVSMEHNRSETKSTFNALKPCTGIA